MYDASMFLRDLAHCVVFFLVIYIAFKVSKGD